MSGMVGVFRRDGAPVEDTLVNTMAATLAHRGPDGCVGSLRRAGWVRAHHAMDYAGIAARGVTASAPCIGADYHG